MEEKREALIDYVLEGNRQLYHRFLQLGGDRLWAEIDLTMPQLKVLFLIVTLNGATMSQIARGVATTLSTATGVADRLIAQNLVRRENDPVDRRLVWLIPTEKAINLVERLAQIGRAQFGHVIRRFDLEELSVIARAQDLLSKALLEVRPEDLAADAEEESSGSCRGQPAV